MSQQTERPLMGQKWPTRPGNAHAHYWSMMGPHGALSRMMVDTRLLLDDPYLIWGDCSFHSPCPAELFDDGHSFMHDQCQYLEGGTCYCGVTWSGNGVALGDFVSDKAIICDSIDNGNHEPIFEMMRREYYDLAMQSLEHLEQLRNGDDPWG